MDPYTAAAEVIASSLHMPHAPTRLVAAEMCHKGSLPRKEKKRDTSDDALDSCCPVLKRNLAPWQLPCNAELLQPQLLIVRRTHGISKMLACRPDLSPCTAVKQSHAMLAHAGTVRYGVMQRLLRQPSLKNNARQRMKWCAQSS